ncbi:undecaprenyl-phosphate glucose phosphotransferase [Methyloferula stellata]|uniref:undecaprenyl-phosphate glucose phosphotransferase n=1 Tax=Methyloferula stellata TaxID=876270 RepID=UPI000370E26E|nr:undecaprenyl-phosphate glucose phosphotransferase [Methyloferula stellata]
MQKHLTVSPQSISLMIGFAEGAAITATILAGQIIYQFVGLGQPSTMDAGIGIGLIATLIYICLAHAAELYRLPAFLNPQRHVSEIVAIWAACLLSLAAILYLFEINTGLSRGSLIAFSSLGLPILLGGRLSVAETIRSRIEKGGITGRPVIAIGDADELDALSPSCLFHEFGMQEVGRIVVDPYTSSNSESVGRSIAIEEALTMARQRKAVELIVAVPPEERRLLLEIYDGLRHSPLPVRLMPDKSLRGLLQRQNGRTASPMPMIRLQNAPMTWLQKSLKRFMDLALSALGILILLPLFAIIAILIKLDSSGPVIFRQHRNGFDQKPFTIYKFRTMRVLEDDETITQVQKEDPRVTRIGRFLRRSSADELPQFLNVFKGNMSLVGPRPHAIFLDTQYRRTVDAYCFRHHFKPGITGWAQVNRARGEAKRIEQIQHRIELDLWYIDNWSILLDMRILWRTCFEVLKLEAY